MLLNIIPRVDKKAVLILQRLKETAIITKTSVKFDNRLWSKCFSLGLKTVKTFHSELKSEKSTKQISNDIIRLKRLINFVGM